ncbi:hypothetical protein ACN2LU_004517, partial [Vibrio vulnificus]
AFMTGCTVYLWTSSLITTVKTNKYGYNKAFKADSQRMAFFIPSLGFVFTVQWFRLGSSVAHYLTRRYASLKLE